MRKHFTRFCAIALLIVAAVTIGGCKKEKEEDPMVQTLDAKPSSPTRVTFTGNILATGNYKVLDYGFVYGIYSNVDESNGTKVSMGADAPAGSFTKDVTNINVLSSSSQSTLYVRAYLKNEKGTVYGRATAFMLPSITITSVSPQSGKVGDQITINGQFFGTPANQISVTFSNVNAKVVQTADSKIVVEVPAGISATHGATLSVQVKIGTQSVYTPSGFTILANIKDFTPKSGAIGSVITFTGDNLPNYYYGGNIRVLFGQIEGSILYNSTLQATVPATITTDQVPVSVIVNGVTTALPGQFTVVAPTINSISPSPVIAGGQLTITGNNLPVSLTGVTATLGNYTLTPNSSSSNTLYFQVPSNIPSGDYTFSLKVGPSTIAFPLKITVAQQSVTGFSPSSGSYGKEVNISGNFIVGQYYNINFGSVSTGAQATSGTSLKTYVPYGLDAGNVKISVQNNGQTMQAPGTFTVIGPSFDSFAPTSGVAGTVVTINGNGFGTSTYNVVVRFGSVQANIISVTDNTIKVMVPSNLNAGAMKISVSANGQTIVNDTNFTATN
ncbi:IPT/TIG domain-containing protein [Mucilaginibacter sp. RS28]|uniref:IPT/TIG domain-containing protein n=1 Tax=Mucilaginibacter straminoryzae TaxID=2932774 RepID=A0A9X1WYY4_9SPHI|nr:IPT/TIG domain-containing protein [Mucilaginibacter straminoryzae]MCJ8208222.1 IPT/TIG domain-containing protein [Mucilaginibacter straminoryzae]